MGERDLYLVLKYKLNPEEARITDTNIRTDYLKEFLSNYLSTQIGAEEDKREAKERQEYIIDISCDLSSDTFYTGATGNIGLTTGIIMRSLDILVLEEDAQSSSKCTEREPFDPKKQINIGH